MLKFRTGPRNVGRWDPVVPIPISRVTIVPGPSWDRLETLRGQAQRYWKPSAAFGIQKLAHRGQSN